MWLQSRVDLFHRYDIFYPKLYSGSKDADVCLAGIVPGLGDIVDAGLNYGLVVRPATELDIPKDLLSKMLLNNAVSVAMG